MYEEIHFRSVQQSLQPGALTYDIGAYDGTTSVLIAEAVGHENVVIIEPANVNWGNIKKNFQHSPHASFPGFLDSVDNPQSVGRIALGSFPPESSAPELDESKLEFRWLHYRDVDPSVDLIPALTVDTLASIVGAPKGMTMDVEGAEFAVLQGAIETLKQHHPLVWVSVHPAFMVERFGIQPQELFEFMRQLGYAPELLTKDHEEHWKFV